MNKVFEWLKKRQFLILWLILGIGFLTYTDNWKVYAEPMKVVQDWCLGAWLKSEPQKTSVSVVEEQAEDSQNSVSEGTAVAESSTDDVAEAEDGFQTDPVKEQPAEETETTVSGNPEDVVYTEVEDDYFTDAVFIGDSRTVGMYEYGGLEETAAFYASTGLTVYKMFDSPIVKAPGQRQKQTVEEALQANSFAKIYLMIGINEMGTGTVETFIAKYKEAVEHLRELQPNAIIYLQGIMKVTTERSEQGDYITNEGIEERNTEIAKLADNRQVYYLDVNPLICDETGGMEASYTFDGVHLKAQYISIWKDYLKEHAVNISVQEEASLK